MNTQNRPISKVALAVGLLAISIVLTLVTEPAQAWFFKKQHDSDTKTSLKKGQAKEKTKMSDAALAEAGFTATQSGLQMKDDNVGTGDTAEAGDIVRVHYTGTLYPSGKKFDSSVDRGDPFEFPLGAGRVIKGWDEGVAGMKEGGKRTLVIPPELGYGDRGVPPVTPASATLKFDVELLEIVK